VATVSVKDDLEAKLVAAFPAQTIDRSMIDEPTAVWDEYDEAGELHAFEGKTWRELPADLIERHIALLVHAGDTLFLALLPAYLRHLLDEPTVHNALPYHVAGELERPEVPTPSLRYERRAARLTSAQRTATADVLGYLATKFRIGARMARVLASWNRA
jgi:hypothetical protein